MLEGSWADETPGINGMSASVHIVASSIKLNTPKRRFRNHKRFPDTRRSR